MRSLVTLGFLSLVGAAAIVGCGDDDPATPGAGGTGTGGSAGSGGGSGDGGSAGSGTAGNAGAAGTAGSAGSGGGPDVDPIATCTGCVELIVPVSGANDGGGTTNLEDQAGFIFTTAAPDNDFSNGVITWRIQALENNANLQINLFAQNGTPGFAGVYPITLPLSAAEFPLGEWRDVVLDLSAYAPQPGAGGDAGPEADAGGGDGGALLDPGAFDKSQIAQFGINVGSTATATGDAVAHVAIDSVTVSGVTGQEDRTFTAGVDGLALNMYQVPPGTPAPVHHP